MKATTDKRKAAIGARIRKLREGLGVKQYELAALCDIRDARLSRIEAGAQEPTPEQLVQLADALGTTTDALLGRKVAR